MRKHIIITAVLMLFISNFLTAQIKSEQVTGKWRVYKRAYGTDTVGSPLKMDLVWTFTKDSLYWNLSGLSKDQVTPYVIKDTTLSIGPMRYTVERIYNDTLIIKKIAAPKNKEPFYVYKDYFFRIEKPKK